MLDRFAQMSHHCFYPVCLGVAQEPDESVTERLWGLTEMFPDSVRSVCGSVTDLSVRSVKTVYQLSCSASWIFFTSSMILFAPVIFEMERAQMEELQRSQQKQVGADADSVDV